MADDGLYDDIEDISSREEPVAVSSTPLKDDESGVYVKTFDENQAPAGKDAAPVVERATNMAQNTMTALYVGNLHWWVTDAQLQTMLSPGFSVSVSLLAPCALAPPRRRTRLCRSCVARLHSQRPCPEQKEVQPASTEALSSVISWQASPP